MVKNTWWLTLIFVFCLLSFNRHQNTPENIYPKDYFRSPVDHKIYITGTFGELRPNHFHSGIDIKSKRGKIGDPLYASAEGYVSRIKVQSGGYGKALYIDHPNGYTTVYAHMDKFAPELEVYVKEQQYAQESFGVDLYPPAYTFNFEKGQNIGTMGNTGRSYGPHVHFEIRDTGTEEPINPMLFGFEIKDNIPPKLHQIKAYGLNDKHETTVSTIRNVKKGKSGIHYIGGDTLSLAAWRMGLGIKAYDHMDGLGNWNGVYAIELFVDDQLWHKTQFERFSFDNTRYLNAHIDYREKLLNKAWFNRSYRLPGNNVPMYPVLMNDGVLDLTTQPKKITFLVYDANDNVSKLVFWVKRKEVNSNDNDKGSYSYKLPYNEDNFISRNDLNLFFPLGSFYENVYLDYNVSVDETGDMFSAVHHIHNDRTPIQKWYEMEIKAFNIPSDKRDKAIIAKCKGSQTPVNHGGEWRGDYLYAKARDFGDFCVMLDEIAPKITPVTFKNNMKGYSKMSFKIKENFKTSKKLDDFDWDGYIDGRWVLFKHNVKNDVVTHRFDKDLLPGKHTIRLVARDNSGNERVFEREFLR